MSITKPPPRDRVYTVRDAAIESALDAAPQAQLVSAGAPQSERLHAWVMYGYRQWQAHQDERAKIAAYAEIAAEDGREAILEAYVDEAVEAGIY